MALSSEKGLGLQVSFPYLEEIDKSLYYAQGDPPFQISGGILDAETIAGFTIRYLLEGYDIPVPIPSFHMSMWGLVTSPYPYVVIASPRDHGKTTAITMSYVLASVLLRESDHVLLVSDTEGQASQYLQDIGRELQENEKLRKDFGLKDFVRMTLTELVYTFKDGCQFRIMGKGAEQRIRGVKWNNKRLNLIVLDDCESDEQVESAERRSKFRRWFYNALLPAGSARCRVRKVGTVMHFDALLYRLLRDPNWVGLCMRAHSDDYKNILWEDRWSKERLQELRKIYARQNNLSGYSREYLNEPIDEEDAYFKRGNIKYYSELPSELTYYIASDFSISRKESSDYSVFAVVGVDEENKWYIVYIVRGKWESEDIIERIFQLHRAYDPVAFLVEDGLIWKALAPVVNTECLKRVSFPRITTISPAGKDKMTRARALQFRFQAGGIFMDEFAPWYEDLYFELMRFPRSPHDDQVDALAHLGMYLESLMYLPLDHEENVEKKLGKDVISSLFSWDRESANHITGY